MTQQTHDYSAPKFQSDAGRTASEKQMAYVASLLVQLKSAAIAYETRPDEADRFAAAVVKAMVLPATLTPMQASNLIDMMRDATPRAVVNKALQAVMFCRNERASKPTTSGMKFMSLLVFEAAVKMIVAKIEEKENPTPDDTPSTLTTTTAPVEVKPAPVKKNPSQWLRRRLTEDQASRSDLRMGRVANKMRQNWEASEARIAELRAADNITVKPATTSPALVETGERVIAITPMALPTRNVSIGGTHVRITTITDYSYVVETLDAGGYGGFQHVGNYPAITMVNNAIARLERESAPAIAVKPATYSPCALTVQWQTLPLLPAPVVKPEAPRPADVKVVHKAHDITAVYGVNHPNEWVVYLKGPMVRGLSFSRFHSAESAIAAAKTHIDIKAAAGIKKGYRGL